MDSNNRNEVIIKEVEKAIQQLEWHTWMCGFGANSDVFELSDGRKAQIQINVTVDEDEISDPTNSFIEQKQSV